ncbi:hypothetical protein [Paracoccus sp. S1E-3]|uniref:hypothetical protein n=1 Tax=Paracoccus sp. S1E-3 TaxID=2756130 RepID=UPI0015EEF1D1|nr:hypothetical protein [Paracoccus sp. S1E-3]MBA4490482.1 hypothetical protein [Paracoccus sp. S1E-3]
MARFDRLAVEGFPVLQPGRAQLLPECAEPMLEGITRFVEVEHPRPEEGALGHSRIPRFGNTRTKKGRRRRVEI